MSNKSAKMVDTARGFIRSSDMREAGIVYLDHESTEIVTSKGVKWKVYGSPVRLWRLYLDSSIILTRLDIPRPPLFTFLVLFNT